MSTLTKDDCYALLAEHNVPANIIQHAEAVARVVVLLAERLRQAGEEINVALAEKGALLHDLDKLLTKETGERHGLMGARLLRGRGYDDVATIVERHLITLCGDEDYRRWTWEERLVHYADKLCIGSKVVSLAERMADLRVRYPDFADVFDKFQEVEEALERDIFCRLALLPGELPELLNGDL